MSGARLLGAVLLAVGALSLLGELGMGFGWVWIALVSAGFLHAYRQHDHYSYLIAGSVAAGTALGLLLEGEWGWDGFFLVSLGAGFLVIDRVEPVTSRWPVYPAAVLTGLGLLIWIGGTGMLASVWFPLLLILLGAYLLVRERRGNWVEVEPAPPEGAEQPEGEAQEAQLPAPEERTTR